MHYIYASVGHMVICYSVKKGSWGVGCEGMDYIQPAQDKSSVAQGFVNTVMSSLF
jgi:hypothetical protein